MWYHRVKFIYWSIILIFVATNYTHHGDDKRHNFKSNDIFTYVSGNWLTAIAHNKYFIYFSFLITSPNHAIIIFFLTSYNGLTMWATHIVCNICSSPLFLASSSPYKNPNDHNFCEQCHAICTFFYFFFDWDSFLLWTPLSYRGGSQL